MKTNLLFCVVFFSLLWVLGCKKDDPEKESPCGVEDPITELPWLKKEIERYQNLPGYATNYSAAIGSTIHKGERVFWIYDAFASDYSPLYRCSGSFFYLPRQNLDKEQQQMLTLIVNIPEMCPYLLWQTPYFEKNHCN